MKKLFAFIAVLLATVVMVSCGYNGTNAENTVSDTTEVVTDTVKTEKDSLVQCKGITKRGTQCERLLWWPDTLCFQHVGQAREIIAE